MNNRLLNPASCVGLYKCAIQVPICLFVISTFLYSCKTKQKTPLAKPKCSLDYKNAKFLAQQLKANECRFNTLDAKASVEAMVDSTSNSFTVSLRVKRDSIIWISISKLGIEAARALITKDSVKIVDRINSQYFKGDFGYIHKLLSSSQLDYEMLQSLLVGNSVSFYDDDEKLKANINDCMYSLGTIRKRKLKKVMEKGKELKEPVQSIYLQPDTYKILRILFYDFDLDRNFDANFSDFKHIDSTQLFPSKINCSIKAQKNIHISIEYLRQKVNEDVSFSFKIPDNYAEIIFKEK